MLLWLTTALATTPAEVEGWRSEIDWSEAGDEASDWLAGYLQIDTVAPPGNERDGALYLQQIAETEGLETRIYDHGDNRASFTARVKGDGSKRPLCLLSHIDVVPSELHNWERDPLSGAIEDGIIHGRGALDMKGMGILELATAIWLKRKGVPLKRDVIVVAVADEEVAGMGMQAMVADHWGDIDCEYLINEGGVAVKDALFEGQTVHPISVAEKGTLWVRLVATGVVGHGSRIEPGEAPNRLLNAMDRLRREYEVKNVIGPAMKEMLKRAGAHQGGLYKTVTGSGVLRNLLVKPRLLKTSIGRAVTTDTLHLTGMSGAANVNVVPSEVWAQYDCRIRPGTTPEQQLQRLKDITADLDGIRWEVINATEANSDSWDDPLFETIAHYAVEGMPEAVAGPILSPGFTDSIFARGIGVKAYGYVPFILTQDEAQTMHGHNEHVSVANMHHGTRVLFSIVADFATR